MAYISRLKQVEEWVRLLEIRIYKLELKHRRSQGQELRSPGVADGDVRDHETDPAGEVPKGK